MSTFQKNMDTIFNLPVVDDGDVKSGELQQLPVVDKKVESDFEYARDNLRDMIDHAKLALDELQAIAETTEAPRAFEVYSTLIKTTVEANIELLNIHQKKTIEEEGPKQQVTNNSLFVGSTAELMKLIQKTQEDVDTN